MTLSGPQKPSPPLGLADLIRATIEPTEPQDTILRILREEFEDVKLGKYDSKAKLRIRDRLREVTGNPSIGWRRSRGWSIVWEGCVFGLNLGYESSPVVDTKRIEEENTGLFSLLRKRNARRQELLTRPDQITFAEHLVKTYLDAKEDVETILLNDRDENLWTVVEHVLRNLCDLPRKHY
jgi:hypothetical protein